MAKRPVADEIAQVRVNVEAVIDLSTRAVQQMVPRGRGAILNVGSTAGYQPFPGQVGYAATKAFVEQNLSDRGWLENCYYYQGSDFRSGFGSGYVLSYMSQMGGWGVLDYALHDAARPAPLVRLGYASTLSSWALVNSGTADSHYGYWFPGPVRIAAQHRPRRPLDGPPLPRTRCHRSRQERQVNQRPPHAPSPAESRSGCFFEGATAQGQAA